jgi:hypothetical protein
MENYFNNHTATNTNWYCHSGKNTNKYSNGILNKKELDKMRGQVHCSSRLDSETAEQENLISVKPTGP